MIYESTRKMSVKEQEAYDLGYLNGKHAAICSPWVKTSDRLPTEEDAIEVHDEWGCTHKEVACLATGWPFEGLVKDRPAMVPGMMEIETIKQRAKQFPYWMPLPKLPEVEG